MKKILYFAAAALLGLASCCGGNNNNNGSTCCSDSVCYPEGSPVAKYGSLKVVGNQLCDEAGNPVQLAGMSTHGWQWCPDCYTAESVELLVKDWNINILRFALYVEEEGYNTDPEKFRAKLCEIVDLCEKMGIYCLVQER